MKNIAFIFPGQGSQFIGMGKSLISSHSVAKEVFEEASDAIGFNLKKLCQEGPEESLNKTENTQPAILTASTAALRVLESELDVTPSHLAGHSLGEFTALVASGSLDFSVAVKLVNLRGQFMQSSVPEGMGKMCAVLGLNAETVREICTKCSNGDNVVVAANINSPEQIVISGSTIAVEKAALTAKEKGAKRTIMLPVSVPSHSPLMKKAAEQLEAELNNTHFAAIGTPIITNVEAEPLTDSGKIIPLLKAQLEMPVRWVDVITKMADEGVEGLIEIGPGKVLTGLTRRINKEIKGANFSESEDLSKVEEFLKN